MEKISRRDFARNMLGAVFTVSLVTSLGEANSFKGSVKSVAHEWIFEMNRLGKELRAHQIRPIEWQEQIETLLSQVEMPDLLKAIDYDQLAKSTKMFDDHETAEDVTFKHVRRLPGELSFAPFFFAMKKGVAIVPHGHQNMTTMHMMLSGAAHGWHYDRLADEPDHLIIKPTKDKMLAPGDVSTISDERDNIHWFRAESDVVYMFNIGIYPLNPKATVTGRDYIDPQHGENLPNGTIRVPRISGEQAYKIYGKSEITAFPGELTRHLPVNHYD